MNALKIYTYYEDLKSKQSERTLDFWVKAWRSQGWDPVVLGVDDAASHPKFERLSAHAQALPTVNGKGFEMACFERWCAFAMFGGLTLDLDVFPTGKFPPVTFDKFTNGCTCGLVGVVAGKPSDMEKIVDLIIGYETQPDDLWFGVPHVSDLVVIRKNPQIFDQHLDLMRCYGQPGWETVPLVHFSNHGLIMPDGMERPEFIQRILQL